MVQERTTGNPLSAGSLSLFMATALPRGENAELKNGTEAIALAVHAGMLAVGFRLVKTGENQIIGEYTKWQLQQRSSDALAILQRQFSDLFTLSPVFMLRHS